MLHSKPIEVKTEKENILVNTSDIIYVGIEGRRVTVETTGGTLKSCERFSYWKKTLDSRLFCQTHQSFIVNMHYVRRYTNNSVTLEYRDRVYTLHISKRRISYFKSEFMSFLGGTQS